MRLIRLVVNWVWSVGILLGFVLSLPTFIVSLVLNLNAADKCTGKEWIWE